jgi:hypothetical protein
MNRPAVPNDGQRRRSTWPQAAALGAATVVGLVLLDLLGRPGAPPPEGPAVLRSAAAGPARDRGLPRIEDTPVLSLEAPVEAGTGGAGPADREGARRRPLPGTERAWREDFVVTLREPGVDIDALLDATIHGSGPDAEKVALLRALLDIRSDKALDALVTAAEEAESHDGPAGAGVPEFCVRTLVERAALDADARAALGRLVARRGSSLQPRLRRTAAAQVALTGTASELALLAADLRGCDDPELLLGVARSLEFNQEATAARAFFSDLPAVATDGEEQSLARN